MPCAFHKKRHALDQVCFGKCCDYAAFLNIDMWIAASHGCFSNMNITETPAHVFSLLLQLLYSHSILFIVHTSYSFIHSLSTPLSGRNEAFNHEANCSELDCGSPCDRSSEFSNNNGHQRPQRHPRHDCVLFDLPYSHYHDNQYVFDLDDLSWTQLQWWRPMDHWCTRRWSSMVA